MAEVWARDILSTFDVHDGAEDFLLNVLGSSLTPAEEVQSLVEASMFADSDKFHHLFGCRLRDPNDNIHEGNDILTFVWQLLAERDDKSDIQSAPWAETDCLIARAKDLADTSPYTWRSLSVGSGRSGIPSLKKRHHRRRSVLANTTSHYWGEEQNGAREEHKDNVALSVLDGRCSEPACTSSSLLKPSNARLQRSSSSRYFVPVIRSSRTLSQRKPAGTVPSVPFPPLSSLHFGLIQEKMAHDPFWLLVAVTFLIKTNGQVSIPVFYKVKQRFPSPTELADPRNAQELLSMIRHLGLATNRLKQIQKYASRFLEAPPTAGILHRVRNYDARDDPSKSGDASCVNPDASLMPDTSAGKASRNSWEIGHMTQGRYTLDSWRIFCRDALLGRAQDWKGRGREADTSFQPEWMRVMPRDKELRAYLRWMWMREGWEWDPVTGERATLRAELRAAIDEGRVDYDRQGDLLIVPETVDD
ncbi:hypothetical protein E4U13_001289 [Claviceps humidiphila]|uniref:5-methylcytosine G/T mismatch-specific DNA glycosylase n=1 Tax=Claviceps humidiphila TaxID=1294629 RepID=A0A9P7Q7R4_9HYPO|nr:hypothetical protein E4U13_001289 [Claviceps humidiphila]